MICQIDIIIREGISARILMLLGLSLEKCVREKCHVLVPYFVIVR